MGKKRSVKTPKKRSVRTPKKTPNPRSLKNLRPAWKKGESGNPGGRPRKFLTEAYEALLPKKFVGDPQGRTWAELIAEGQGKAAIKGKANSAREMADRVEGKVPLPLMTPKDESLNVNLVGESVVIAELLGKLASK